MVKVKRVKRQIVKVVKRRNSKPSRWKTALEHCSKITQKDIEEARRFYADKANREEITGVCCTYPKRGDVWIQAYKDLRMQCDRFVLVLEGYDEIPRLFMKDFIVEDIAQGKLKIELCGKDGVPESKGCQNKFMHYGDFPGYYLTFDDDMRYSENVAYFLIKCYEKYGRKAIVSFHGIDYKIVNGKLDGNVRTKVHNCSYAHGEDYCHRLGCGCMCSRPADFPGLTKDLFMSYPRNTGDDEILAIWAQKNNVPFVVADNSHTKILIIRKNQMCGLCYNKRSMVQRYRFLESYSPWKKIRL